MKLEYTMESNIFPTPLDPLMTEEKLLQEALNISMPASLEWSIGSIAAIKKTLHLREAKYTFGYSKRRKQEFVAGRTHARRALTALGVKPVAIPVGLDRAPIWPSGVVGSITHSKRFAGAIVARQAIIQSVGFDIEEVTPNIVSLIPLILTSQECKILQSRPANEHALLASLIFSIKESVFKAYWPLTYLFLEFKDVEISLSSNLTEFQAHICPDKQKLDPRPYCGSCGNIQGIVFAITTRVTDTQPESNNRLTSSLT